MVHNLLVVRNPDATICSTAESGFPGLPVRFLRRIWIPQKLTILEDVLPVKKQTSESDVILLHLVYNSRSGAKPDRSGSGGLSMIANDSWFLGAETCNEYQQKVVQYQPWIYVGKIKGQLLLFLATFRDFSAAHAESVSAPI